MNKSNRRQFKQTFYFIFRLIISDCTYHSDTDVFLMVEVGGRPSAAFMQRTSNVLSHLIKQLTDYNDNVSIGMATFSSNVQLKFPIMKFTDINIFQSMVHTIQSENSNSNLTAAIQFLRRNMTHTQVNRQVVIFLLQQSISDLPSVQVEVARLSRDTNVTLALIICNPDFEASDEDFNALFSTGINPMNTVIVEESDTNRLRSLAALTKYYTCDDDIFKKRHN